MTPLDPPDERRETDAEPAAVLRRSEYHERFVEHTLRSRSDALGREMLAREWAYIGALLAVPATEARVLDLACGSGLHSLAWAEKGAHVTGIDFDLALLETSRRRLGRGAPRAPKPDWASADATGMPFRTASFDVVFCNSLLEHVPAWRAVVAESARVLKPGGLFIVYTTNRTCPLQVEVNHFPFYSWLPDAVQRRVMAWIMANRRDLVNWTDFPAVNWFTFPGMRRAFEDAGFQPFDRLDLMVRNGAGGMRGLSSRAVAKVPALKWAYYFYAISMGLYGVKR
jgi:2-polyprenyl-6-hydroxyphenyl methylase/3-demethylubiquinone-9 3-methyltransferase